MIGPLQTARLDAVAKVRKLLTEMELEAQEESPCPECLDVMGGNIVQILFAAFAKPNEGKADVQIHSYTAIQKRLEQAGSTGA